MPDNPAGDDLDPTRAPNWVEDEVEVIDAPDGADPEATEAWRLEDGFVDESGTVRLWTDPYGVPQRVGLSRYWRDTIKRVPLADMFAEVFFQAAFLLSGRGAPLPEAKPIEDPEELSPELLQRMVARQNELDVRLAELDESDEGYSVWSGEGATGTAEEGRVSVSINMMGSPESAAFDQKWLGQASAGAVGRAVIAAYQDARTKFTEPVYTPGERDEIASDYLTVTETLVAAATKGMAGLRPINPAQLPNAQGPAIKEAQS